MKGLPHSTQITARMQSTGENQLWIPGRSLWLLVAEHVPESELPEIQRALGCALLDEYSGLHLEAEMLYKTWQEIQQAGNHGNRVGTPLKCQQGSPLADPPPIKELLKAEVRIIQQSIRERAISKGRPHSCCSLQPNIEEEIEAMRDKLNITDIEKVVDQLRSVLNKECEALKIYIEHLKENIKRGSRSSCEVYKVDSMIAELRDPRGAIHMDLEQNQSSVASSCWPPSSVPVTDLKNRHRFSAKFRTSAKILEGATAASVMRPHPPPPLCQLKPSPPPTARPRARCISTSASTEARKLLTPLCHSATACQHGRSHLSALPPRNISDKLTKRSPSAKPEGADVHSDVCSSNQNAKKHNLPQNPSRFSVQRAGFVSTDREKRSLVYKSGHADINSPHVIPPSSEGAQCSVDSTDRSLSTSGTSTGETHLNRDKSASERVRSGVTGKYSLTFETVTPLEQNLNRTGCHGIHRNTSGQVVQQLSHRGSPGRAGKQRQITTNQPASTQIDGLVFTSTKEPLGVSTCQPIVVQKQ